LNTIKEEPSLAALTCLDLNITNLQPVHLYAIKHNMQIVADALRKIKIQNIKDVYDLQISSLFSRNEKDLYYLIRQIEAELKAPRELQMVGISFAIIWLYREQISLLRELGEFDVDTRRNPSQIGRVRERSKDMEEDFAGSR
jgi:hypothetical protein